MAAAWRLVTSRMLLLICLLFVLPVSCERNEPQTATILINNQPFILELALDPATREHGLMGRDYIAPDGGMLFVFPDAGFGPRSFWMGNCMVDIDIIFLDAGRHITAMHHMKAEPPRGKTESEDDYRQRMPLYSSRLPAQFAIELAGGTLEKFDPPLQLGQQIEFDAEPLKQRAK